METSTNFHEKSNNVQDRNIMTKKHNGYRIVDGEQRGTPWHRFVYAALNAKLQHKALYGACELGIARPMIHGRKV